MCNDFSVRKILFSFVSIFYLEKLRSAWNWFCLVMKWNERKDGESYLIFAGAPLHSNAHCCWHFNHAGFIKSILLVLIVAIFLQPFSIHISHIYAESKKWMWLPGPLCTYVRVCLWESVSYPPDGTSRHCRCFYYCFWLWHWMRKVVWNSLLQCNAQ